MSTNGPAYYLGFKTIGLSTVNGRKPCTLLQAAKHNLREIQAELGCSKHIDPKRSAMNKIIVGPDTAEGVQKKADELLALAGIGRLRRDHCQAIEAVFSLPIGTGIDHVTYFDRCAKWIEGACPLPVLSCVIHHDEAAMHMHMLLLPVLNAKHVGGKPIERESHKLLQESFFTNVAGPAGLNRGKAKMRGTVKKWGIEAVLRECNARGLKDACGPLWPVLLDAISHDPAEALAALGIELESIRPDQFRQQHATQEVVNPIGITEPIGIDRNPIGIVSTEEKDRSLSCVGIAHSPHSFPAQTAPIFHSASQPIKTVTVDDTSIKPVVLASRPKASRPKVVQINEWDFAENVAVDPVDDPWCEVAQDEEMAAWQD